MQPFVEPVLTLPPKNATFRRHKNSRPGGFFNVKFLRDRYHKIVIPPRFADGHKRFEDLKVLDDVSIDIKKGAFVSVIGVSGCGYALTV